VQRATARGELCDHRSGVMLVEVEAGLVTVADVDAEAPAVRPARSGPLVRLDLLGGLDSAQQTAAGREPLELADIEVRTLVDAFHTPERKAGVRQLLTPAVGPGRGEL